MVCWVCTAVTAAFTSSVSVPTMMPVGMKAMLRDMPGTSDTLMVSSSVLPSSVVIDFSMAPTGASAAIAAAPKWISLRRTPTLSPTSRWARIPTLGSGPAAPTSSSRLVSAAVKLCTRTLRMSSGDTGTCPASCISPSIARP